MTTIPPRRYPRKMKKQMKKVSMDFTVEEYQKIKEMAKEQGMRPTHFVQYALVNAIEKEGLPWSTSK